MILLNIFSKDTSITTVAQTPATLSQLLQEIVAHEKHNRH